MGEPVSIFLERCSVVQEAKIDVQLPGSKITQIFLICSRLCKHIEDETSAG